MWTIRVRRGEEVFEETCHVLVLALGSLARLRWPNIEGLKEFKGPVVHTADWNLDEKKLEGKNVGVIGNVSARSRCM